MTARKAQKKHVNLLPQSEFETSIAGRILKWVLSTFRVLVIVVEGVVIAGFFGRFYLDIRIADLDDEIEQKQIIIKSYSTFEKEFRETQKRLEVFSFMISDENRPTSTISKVITRLPEDVFLTQLEISGGETKIRASSSSEQSIAQFIANLKVEPDFSTVHLVQLQTQEGLPFVNFSLVTEETAEAANKEENQQNDSS